MRFSMSSSWVGGNKEAAATCLVGWRPLWVLTLTWATTPAKPCGFPEPLKDGAWNLCFLKSLSDITLYGLFLIPVYHYRAILMIIIIVSLTMLGIVLSCLRILTL